MVCGKIDVLAIIDVLLYSTLREYYFFSVSAVVELCQGRVYIESFLSDVVALVHLLSPN